MASRVDRIVEGSAGQSPHAERGDVAERRLGTSIVERRPEPDTLLSLPGRVYVDAWMTVLATVPGDQPPPPLDQLWMVHMPVDGTREAG